ncbi:hypothetical protein EDB84DRAFT_1409938, partial [Lactarius hengduanensis]
LKLRHNNVHTYQDSLVAVCGQPQDLLVQGVVYFVIKIATLLLFTWDWVIIKELSWFLSDGCSACEVDVHVLTPTL